LDTQDDFNNNNKHESSHHTRVMMSTAMAQSTTRGVQHNSILSITIMFGDTNSVGLVNDIQQHLVHTCGLGLRLVDLCKMASQGLV